jgi:hypothetical protein
MVTTGIKLSATLKVIHRFVQRAPYCVPLVAAAIVHGSRVFGGYFHQEDFLHLFQINNGGFWRFLMTSRGGHMYVVRNLVFYSLFKIFHLHPVPWYLSVLGLHLVNVKLLYELILRFTQQRRAALIFATLWGISPVNQGCLASLCAIGLVMVVTLLLWLLLDITRIKEREERIAGRVVIRWYLVLLGMAASFGIGIGIAMVFGVVAWLLLRGVSNRMPVTVALLSLSVTVPLIYGLYAIGAEDFGCLPPRAFSTAWYLELTAIMFTGLICCGLGSLLTGLLFMLRLGGYAVPISCAGCLAVAFLLSISMRRLSKEVRAQIMALGLLIVAIYGMIALGRGWLMGLNPDGTLILGLLCLWEYHYVPPMLFAIGIAILYAAAGKGLRCSVWRRAADRLTLALLDVMFIPSLVAGQRIWPDRGLETREQLYAISHGIRKAVDKAGITTGTSAVYIRNTSEIGIPMGVSDTEVPKIAAWFVVLFPENEVLGRRVYFVEDDPAIVEYAKKRQWSRTSKLLVTPQEASGQPVETISRHPSR